MYFKVVMKSYWKRFLLFQQLTVLLRKHICAKTPNNGQIIHQEKTRESNSDLEQLFYMEAMSVLKLSLNSTIRTWGGLRLQKWRARKFIFVLLLNKNVIGNPHCIKSKKWIYLLLHPTSSMVKLKKLLISSSIVLGSVPVLDWDLTQFREWGTVREKRCNLNQSLDWFEKKKERLAESWGVRKQVEEREDLEGLASFDFSVLFSF